MPAGQCPENSPERQKAASGIAKNNHGGRQKMQLNRDAVETEAGNNMN